MTALRTAIKVTAEAGGAAVVNGAQHLQLRPGQPPSALFQESRACLANNIGHLEER
jgi:hypothetical protein